jgi:hypothetical protein
LLRREARYLPISEHVKLEKLQRLRRFEMRALIYEYDFKRMQVIQDITRVLASISPPHNILQDIVLDLTAYGPVPWTSTRNQAWAALAKEVARISSHGRTVKLDVTLLVDGPGPSTKRDSADLYSYLDGILKAGFSGRRKVEYKLELTHW